VTAPTEYAVELLRTAARVPGAIAISGGVSIDYATRPPASVDHDVATVLFVGRLDPEKRVDELISAFGSVVRQRPARLEIIGDGSSRRRLERQVERMGLRSKVVFHGFVDGQVLGGAYLRCDVFCMPSVTELQSLATLEAMAAGCAVIAARSPALEELVQSGQSGLLYEAGDVGELTRSLSMLLSDAKLRQRMGQSSAAIARQHSLTSTLEGYVRLYQDLLATVATTATSGNGLLQGR
jgi:glycosyltransferase involved in cell wall biosynthesis